MRIATPFFLTILMSRLGKISLGLEVVLVSSAIVSNMWGLISINVFSLSSIRKIALALLIVINFLIGYRLNIMIIMRHLMSTRKVVIFRHLPSLCPPILCYTVSIESILSL